VKTYISVTKVRATESV